MYAMLNVVMNDYVQSVCKTKLNDSAEAEPCTRNKPTDSHRPLIMDVQIV